MASRKVVTTYEQAVHEAWDEAIRIYPLVAGKARAQRSVAYKDIGPGEVRATITSLATIIRAAGGTCETPMEATARRRAAEAAEDAAQAAGTPSDHVIDDDELDRLLAARDKRNAAADRAAARSAARKASASA